MSQDDLERNCLETKLQTIFSYSHFEKVTVQNSTAYLRSVISNKIIIYQLPHSSIKLVIINMTLVWKAIH